MPQLTIRGTKIHYESCGDGPETLVFAHGCLLNCRMFDELVGVFRDQYRCVVFDFRGHGESSIPRDGYDMDSLADDAAALIQSLECGPCHFLGFSMGGFAGMRLAVQHPELLRSLILVGTSASREPHALRFRMLSWMARLLGPRAVMPWIMPVQFSRAFLRDPHRAESKQTWCRRIASIDRFGGVRSAGEVIRRPDYSNRLCDIHLPTLIVVGEQDRATPPTEAVRLQTLIAGSELVRIPHAGHAVPIERPKEVGDALNRFLNELKMAQRLQQDYCTRSDESTLDRNSTPS